MHPVLRTGSTALLAALALAAPARAQRTLSSVGEDFGHFFGDSWHVVTSPFRMDAGDLPAVAGVAAGYAATTLADVPIQDWIRGHENAGVVRAFEPFGEGHLAQLALTERLEETSAVLYVLGFAVDSRDLRDAAIGCTTADVTGSLVRQGVYAAVARARPTLTASGQRNEEADRWSFPGRGWDYHSFFGGHVANIMSCVTFWNQRFHMGLVEPALYAFAVGVGAARTIGEKHWTSDTLLGIVFGYAIGREVAHRYAERASGGGADAKAASSAALSLPEVNLLPGPRGGSAVYVGWRWRF